MVAPHLAAPGGKPYEPPRFTGFLVFALLGIAAGAETAGGALRPAWLSWAGLAVSSLLYGFVVVMSFRGRPRPAWIALAALAAVVTALAWRFGGGWHYLFPLVGVACGVALYGRAVRWALAALTAVTAATVWAAGGRIDLILAFSWGTFSTGVVVAVILHLHAVIGELRETRQRLAEAAVAQERLRFARDLHDLLGHTLSVIVVKAEAARRLARRDPGQAERQAADIETVGRQALGEVREAVTGYRRGGLADELDRAADALRAAGVEVVLRRTGPPPGAHAESLLGWVVREGVTNVIRHSGATRAEIHVTGTSVTIRDDGRAGPAEPGTTGVGSAGSGLRGLAERLAESGGLVEAGPLAEGGFRLSARLPGSAPSP
ncbi:sensor histidine kinase [Nonomuraea cavernae]|uniref:sensor histidine kinase n=1 Tax=Nonomuraea cavernae TaxID=2045107 RepID=UPI0033CC4D0F